MRQIKNSTYWSIKGWMVNNLNLQPSELLIYAYIYNFTHDGNSDLSVSYDYLSTVGMVKRRKAILAIKKLEADGLIFKYKGTKDNPNYVCYRADLNKVKELEKELGGFHSDNQTDSAKYAPEGAKKTLEGAKYAPLDSAKNAPNMNLSYNEFNNDVDKEEKKEDFSPPPKKQFSSQEITDEEIEMLYVALGEVDAEKILNGTPTKAGINRIIKRHNINTYQFYFESFKNMNELDRETKARMRNETLKDLYRNMNAFMNQVIDDSKIDKLTTEDNFWKHFNNFTRRIKQTKK